MRMPAADAPGYRELADRLRFPPQRTKGAFFMLKCRHRHELPDALDAERAAKW